jgi:threonine dehydrogenase-like Zn-dependent dehydrogenase
LRQSPAPADAAQRKTSAPSEHQRTETNHSGHLIVRGVKMTSDGIRVVASESVPGEGDVRVRVASSGICGSDLHMASFGPSRAILGHEFSGTLDDGTPVAVLPVVHCGTCDRCLAGSEQQCRNSLGAMYGLSLDGGLADEAWVNPACATPLPDGVALDQANLVEPLAVALHGVNRADVVSGMQVLVLGAGPIGLCTVATARYLGAQVDLEGHRPNRVTVGERLGASVDIGTDYDVVLDAAGTQSSLDRAIELTRPGGTIAILGTYWNPVKLGLGVQMKELTLLPCFMYGHHHGVGEFVEAARILHSAPDLADIMNSHHFSLDDAAEAFRVAAEPSECPIKVVVHP